MASRRGAEQLVAAGKVTVDGERVVSLSHLVASGSIVCVDGELIRPATQIRLWRYHKPVGLVCTHHDPQGRPTVFSSLPPECGRVISVGRLDVSSEGLLLLTNDGALARTLEHPDSGHERTYRVRVRGVPSTTTLQAIRAGVTVEGVRYRPAEVTLEGGSGSNRWLRVCLREGKNREIRRIFEHFGHPVSRLIRVSYAGLTLDDLPLGALAPVPDALLRRLMDAASPAQPSGE